MPFLLILFSCLLGYGIGYVSRWLLVRISAPSGVCNLDARGKKLRAWLSIALAFGAFFTGVFWLGLCAGFVYYESRSRWCIVRGIRSE